MKVDLVVEGARSVLVCDDEATVLADVSIAIVEGRILHIGPSNDVANRFEPARVLDASGHLVMPGFVNLHTHLPMTLLRGIAENVDLQDFLTLVWAEEARVMNPGGVELGARLGAVECLLGGTTTALDMYFHPDAAHRGAVDVGLRHVGGPIFFSSDGPDSMSWTERMEEARKWPDVLREIGGPYVPPALMPHATYTVDVDQLREVGALAREIGALMHTHCAENDQENQQTEALRGQRPVSCLASAGVLDSRLVIGHGVRLSDRERTDIAVAGTSVAHCPGSNLKLASGAADIVGYRADGILVGLGTDGCSSSNDLDMFAVMRLAANLARLVREDPAAISAADVVRMATLDGARALGLADHIGSVEAGKQADLILIDTRSPHLTPLRDPHTAVVFAAGRSDVRHVLVDGEVVVDDRRPTRVDLPDLLSQVEAVASR